MTWLLILIWTGVASTLLNTVGLLLGFALWLIYSGALNTSPCHKAGILIKDKSLMVRRRWGSTRGVSVPYGTHLRTHDTTWQTSDCAGTQIFGTCLSWESVSSKKKKGANILQDQQSDIYRGCRNMIVKLKGCGIKFKVSTLNAFPFSKAITLVMERITLFPLKWLNCPIRNNTFVKHRPRTCFMIQTEQTRSKNGFIPNFPLPGKKGSSETRRPHNTRSLLLIHFQFGPFWGKL